MLSFSSDRQFLAVSFASGHDLQILNVRDGQPVRFPVHAEPSANQIVWLPGSDVLCLASTDERVRLWNLKAEKVDVLTPEAGNVLSVAISPDGKTLAVGTQDGVIKLFSLSSQREIAVLKGHVTFVSSLIFSPDGKLLLSEGGDGSRVWRTDGPPVED
jgi:WD40 repeat protein